MVAGPLEGGRVSAAVTAGAPGATGVCRGHEALDLPGQARLHQDRRAARRAAPAPSDRLRFVIQKHDATRLHYDLRLELDGVFKSWAVTKGPSVDPHDKRLAVEVEDHPLDYGDFEGTIPKGQYGGGTVQLWDRGYWAPQGMTAEDGLAKGDLKFTLEGEHLHGSWVLVRMKGDRVGGKRTNWLLIKHRDELARRATATRCWRTTARSRPAGRWRTSRRARAGAQTVHARAAASGGRRRGVGLHRRPGAGRARRSAEDGGENEPKRRHGRDAGVHRAATLPLGRAPAGGRGLGARDQVRRLPHPGARRAVRRSCAPAKGSIGRSASAPARERAPRLPDCIIDGEIVALDADGAPDFAALQAALSDGGATSSSSSRSTCCMTAARTCASSRCRTQDAPRRAACGTPTAPARCCATSTISRAAATPCCNRPASCRWRASSPSARRALRLRPERDLDQGQMPRRA